MDLTREEQQRKEFRSILFDLAELQFSLKDAASRSKVYQRLEKLYHTPEGAEKYRHFYSDIFIVLTQIQQGDYPGSIDILGQNLAAIRKGYQPINTDENGKKIDIQNALKKLYDHVSLDIARINYSDAADRKVEQRDSIMQIKAEVIGVQTSIEAAQKALDTEVTKVRNDVKDVQKEHIAILGIFASIVLTFTGGIAFSTSVLENMHTMSIYRVIVITLLIGLVLVNVLFGLFYYISKLIHDSDRQRIKPLLTSNAVIILLLALTIFAWKTGFVEKRNYTIDEKADIVCTEVVGQDNPAKADSTTVSEPTIGTIQP